MKKLDLIIDSKFLNDLVTFNLRTFYTQIIILDRNERPIRAIQGRVQSGFVSISGNSTVKRSGNISLVAEKDLNDLTDIDNFLSTNKKIKIQVGLENKVNQNYDDIIWFPLGIFVITNPSLTHTVSGVNISLQFKDKMCLLNGDLAGSLPTSVTFHEYDQVIGLQEVKDNNLPITPNSYTVYNFNGKYYRWNSQEGYTYSDNYINMVGEIEQVPQRIFDIIMTLVANFGYEAISNIIINDVPLEIKQLVRYIGSETLYYNNSTGQYTIDTDDTLSGEWISFKYNEDCGYMYTDFIYPGELISAIGDNVCSVLDKITSQLGNHHYYYDIDGRFIFEEKRNNLNWQYEPVFSKTKDYTLKTRNGIEALILDDKSYQLDLSNTNQSIFTFKNESKMISSYSNSLNFANIKNDFHIWGKNQDKLAIHYHIAIKEKPFPTKGGYGDEPPQYGKYNIIKERDDNGILTGRVRLTVPGEKGEEYIPTDWRAELYMQGLTKQQLQQRPDIYEQELLDLFDDIYDMASQEFKVDIIHKPNELLYWFDYINPTKLYDISVDNIGTRMYTYQKDKIRKLYNTEVPDVVIIPLNFGIEERSRLRQKCKDVGYKYTNVSKTIYENIALGTYGYTAQETARDLLYQYTDYLSAISLSAVPIYHLDTNNRITVNDRAAGIHGDYVINSMTLPFDAQQSMSISASRALSRD